MPIIRPPEPTESSMVEKQSPVFASGIDDRFTRFQFQKCERAASIGFGPLLIQSVVRGGRIAIFAYSSFPIGHGLPIYPSQSATVAKMSRRRWPDRGRV